MHVKEKRQRCFYLVGLSCAAVIITFYFSASYFRIDLLERLELKTLDYRFLLRGMEEPDSRIVIIGIDKKSLDRIEDPMVFWRPHFAKIIEKISDAGAKTIGLDFVLSSPLSKKIEAEGHDRILALALLNADNVILAKTFIHEKVEDLYVVKEPVPILSGVNPYNIGFVNLTNDSDNTVRRQTQLLMDSKGEGHLSFGLAVFARFIDKIEPKEIYVEKKMIKLGARVIPLNRYGDMMINFAGPSGTYHQLPFYEIWKMAYEGHHDYFRNNFANKIVLIGTTNFLHQDFKPTPFFNSKHYDLIRSTYGVEIWANVIDTMLQEKYITRAPAWCIVMIILIIGLSVCYVSLRRSLIESLIYTFLISFVYLTVCLVLFITNRLWIDIVSPSVTIPLTFAAVFVCKYTDENRWSKIIKRVFEHYLHPAIVSELLKNPENVKLGGSNKYVTIFFSDIVGFASIVEHLAPEQLIEFINSYFTEMSDVIIEYKGTIDQYAGDAIMSFFGAPLDNENHAVLSCLAALESQKRLNVLRKRFSESNLPDINMRIGINTGNVVVGNVGGRNRYHYTVLGNDVNVAARLEGANKIYGTNIMISEETYNLVKHTVAARELDIIRVKGIATPVNVYELLSLKEELSEKSKRVLELFTVGLESYKGRRWEEAERSFALAIEIDPYDGPTRLYLNRCAAFMKSPPPHDWDGVSDV